MIDTSTQVRYVCYSCRIIIVIRRAVGYKQPGFSKTIQQVNTTILTCKYILEIDTGEADTISLLSKIYIRYLNLNLTLLDNLTCSSAAQFYLQRPWPGWSWLGYYAVPAMNCTAWADYSRDHPEYAPPWYGDVVNNECMWSVRRPSDGRQFVQGIDGQIKADKFRFEVTYCGRNTHSTFALHHVCCPGKYRSLNTLFPTEHSRQNSGAAKF